MKNGDARIPDYEKKLSSLKKQIESLKKAEKEHKKLSKALKDSEEKFRIIFEYAPDAIYLNDMKGNFLDGNKAAEELIGYAREELIGKSFLKERILPPNQLLKAANNLRKNMLGKSTGPDEFILKDREGREIPVEVSTFPVRIGGKSVVLGIARDRRVQKKAEDALKHSEMIYRALFEHANDAVVLMSPDGVIQAINQKTASMLGFTRKELIGKTYRDVVVSEDYADSDSRFRQIKEGKILPLYERTLRRKDGSTVQVEINASLIKDPSENPLYVQSIVRDITQRKIIDKQIKDSLSEKEVLLKEVHHRVKNNMQIISSLLRLQTENVHDKQILDIFNNCQDRIRTMALIHEQLYRSENFAQIDFSDYVHDLIEHLKSSHTGNGKNIRFDYAIDSVVLDINRAIPCGLIITELVTNSLKHAFSGIAEGVIEVKLTRKGSEGFRLLIADNGRGFPGNYSMTDIETLGMRLVRDLVYQIDGIMKFSHHHGTKYEILF